MSIKQARYSREIGYVVVNNLGLGFETSWLIRAREGPTAHHSVTPSHLRGRKLMNELMD